MSCIHVTIDCLVLHGLDPADRQAFVNGLKRALSRILSDPDARAAWARPRRTPVLRLGKMAWEPGLAGAHRLGGGIARAIGKGMEP